MMREVDELNELKAQQEKHRQELKENRDKVLERKTRTRRLIKRGAIAEGFVGDAEGMTDEEFYQALRRLCGMNGGCSPSGGR